MMNNTVAIIIAAGEATRWNNYLGVPKHYIEIDGEPIIERTVRQLIERGVDNVYVVSKDYDIKNTISYSPTIDYENNADADKFLNSAELWNTNGRTIVLYGDVFFTDHAMNTIVNYKSREWRLFCRPRASRYTKTPWGECFAQSFYPEHIGEHFEALRRIADLKKQGKINRCGGWEHVRAMMGVRDNKLNTHVLSSPLYVIINDFTDDFDYPEDYDRFIRNWNK